MSNKSRLAEDFLRPLENEEQIAEQLSSELTEEAGDQAPTRGLPAEGDSVGTQRAALAACWLEKCGYRTVLLRPVYGSGIDLLASGSRFLAVRCSALPSDDDETRAALHQLRAATEAYSQSAGQAIEPVIWDSDSSNEAVTRLCMAAMPRSA